MVGVVWKREPWRRLWLALGLCLCALSRPAGAEPPTLNELREQADRELAEELTKLAPDALPILREANRLRDTDRKKALELYTELHQRVPGFSGATRRICSLKSRAGQKAEALASCREAARDESPGNLGVLATALITAPATESELTEAKTLIGRALALAPHDPWLLTDRCEIMIAAREWSEARRCAKEARGTLPPELAAMLLSELASEIAHGTATEPELREAKDLADTAGGLAPNEAGPQIARCEVALRASDGATLKDCVAMLQRVAPNVAPTHFYAAIEAANRSDWDSAERALDRALATGGSPAAVADLRARIRDSEPWWERYGERALIVLGVWLAGLLALFVAGVVLGQVAMRAARQPATEATGRATGMSAALRTAYSGVIALGCIYYYVSIPLVLLLVLSLGAGIVYGVLAAGFIAVKLFVVVGFVVLVSIGAMLKSVFVRVRSEDPGLALELREHPKLAALLEEVARTLGARSVDRVFMVPDASVSVFERGSMLRQMRGQGERCLIIGAAVLDGMRTGELRAILAHEFGHFSNRDTAGGQFALAVRNSLNATVVRLAHGGAATRFNPAWLFVTSYWKLFLRISQGASRLQEVLADRWAAYAYGAENFVRGLTHVIRADVAFSRHVTVTVNELAKSKAPLKNLYRYEPSEKPADAQIEQLVTEALSSPGSPFDSHPPPQERIALVRALPQSRLAEPRPDDETSAWSLFENQAAVEERLTSKFCEAVYSGTGIRLGVPGT